MVADPDQALETIATFDPHLIFLDLTFPERDGLSILQDLAPRNPNAPVILISACEQEVMRSAHRVAQRLGLQILDPLPKPVSIVGLHGILREFESQPTVVTGAAIRHALENDQITLEYQPKVCLETGAYRGVEALARWRVPGGVIPPDRFIPVVERDDRLAHSLLVYVLKRAARDKDAWSGPGAHCAVNMSGRCVYDRRLPDLLTTLLKGTQARPQDFVLEMTETASFEQPSQTEEILTGLRLRRFGLSLDDFGTGHSSLLQLQQMPFNEIKIDRQFIETVLQDNRSDRIVRMMVGLGAALGSTTVAEGIKKPDQARMLAGIGCSLGQGFYFARPLTAEALVSWRHQWTQNAVKDSSS